MNDQDDRVESVTGQDCVSLFADGACSGNPGPGGWGVLLRYRGQEKELSGAEPATTNNRMELLAVIQGLEALKRPMRVHVCTDSQYVMKGITEWLAAWKRRGWKTADRQPVKNVDLWLRLETALAPHQVEWQWVRGHSGHPENERVDQLATAARNQLKANGIQGDPQPMNERQIVLDTETTGLDPAQGHRVIEIGCIELLNRRLTRRQFHVYLQPDRAIDAEAVQVHGLTNEFLASQPHFPDIADEFLHFVLDAELIIHNAPFDLGFLNHELRRCGRGDTVLEQICRVEDTLLMARQRHPGQRNSLDALCKRYNIDNSQRTLHGALLDAEILADVYLAMTRQQDSLFVPATATHATLENGQARRAALLRDRPPLPVIPADAGECAAHASYLDLLDKSSGGSCVWRRLETAESV